MTTILVALFVFILLTAGAVGILLFAYVQSRRNRKTGAETSLEAASGTSKDRSLYFRFADVTLPVAVLVVSVTAFFVFYGRVPANVAYHFAPDGSADRWISRGMLAITMLAPQFLLASLSAGIAFVMVKFGGRNIDEGRARLSAVRGVIVLMSNMVAFPQLVLCYAMLDILLYNAYQVHLFPVYIFAILVMLVGGFVMGIFFFRAVRPRSK